MNRIYFATSILIIALIACQTISTQPTQLVPTQPAATQLPATQAAAGNTPSSESDCVLVIGNYDLPHVSTSVSGKEFYDMSAQADTSTVTLEATAVEAVHLVSPADNVDGTLVYARMDDVEADAIYQFYVLIYLPDAGAGVGNIPADSTIIASGPIVGYFYPPENLLVSFPNEGTKTKFPSIKAETATYGCN